MIVATAHGPSALWYATRGTGAVTLLLLTASVVLGIAETRAWRLAGASLFAVSSLHRTLSLLAVALLTVHVVTTLLDPFPHIGALVAVVPFISSYRTLWLGLGTVAADLLIALVLTSLLRRRLGYGAWRGLHWFAYACWPVALLHGLGTGSDPKSTWMLLLVVVCVGAVLVACAARLAAAGTPSRMRAAGSTALVIAVPVFLAWFAQGPLAKGWARRAGTPANVLSAFAPPPVRSHAGRTPAAAADAFARPFSSDLRGVIDRGQSSDGMAVVDLRLRARTGPHAVLRIRLGGQPLDDGGLLMRRSAVTFGPPAESSRYSGRIQSLNGNALRALVGDPQGRAVNLDIRLSLQGDTVTAAMRGTPVEAQ